MQRDKERRRHPRLKIDGNLYVTFGPQTDRICKIKDVSEGGLAFKYLLYGIYGNPEVWEIVIFSPDGNLDMLPISCRKVYETPVSGELNLVGIQSIRCGVEFTKLSKKQFNLIASLLKSNTLT